MGKSWKRMLKRLRGAPAVTEVAVEEPVVVEEEAVEPVKAKTTQKTENKGTKSAKKA